MNIVKGAIIIFSLTLVRTFDKGVVTQDFDVILAGIDREDSETIKSFSVLHCAYYCQLRGHDCCAAIFIGGECSLSWNCKVGGDVLHDHAIRVRKTSVGNVSSLISDCNDLPDGLRSGIYTITPTDSKGMEVYCDAGGWTVIQRRVSAATSFYRNWLDYKKGFGNLKENFWLGNDYIHALVKQKPYRVRFDLEDKNGDTAYAEYSTFFVDDEISDYELRIKGYSGNAGDGMRQGEVPKFHNLNRMRFSTPDRDNDKHSGYHCAKDLNKGGWWINACTKVNMNGVYNSTHTSIWAPDPIYWFNWRGHEHLKRVQIKIKPF